MSQQTSQVIKSLIANTVDIYHNDVINMFLVDGKINLDFLLNHNLTKISIMYQITWNHLFGTWGTKRDIMSFFNDVLNIKTNYKNFSVSFDMNLLNAILAHEPFIIANIGAVHQMHSLRDAFQTALMRINEVSTTSFICDILQQKWKHRFNTYDVGMMTISTVLKTFVKYQLNSDTANITDITYWRNISGYKSDCRDVDNYDVEFLSKGEVIQYYIYRDNRFMLQLSTFAVVVIDEDVSAYDISNFIISLKRHLNKNVMVICTTDSNKYHNITSWYNVLDEYFHLLPKVSTKLFLFSSKTNVYNRRLCTVPIGSVLITENATITLEQRRLFSLVLTPNTAMVSPQNSIYYFPNISKNNDRQDKLVRELEISLWKDYHSQKCPFQTNNSRNSGLLFSNFMAIYLKKNISNLFDVLSNYSNDSQSSPKMIEIICADNRFNVTSLVSVLISLYNIVRHPTNAYKYHGSIVTSKDSLKRYEEFIEHVGLSGLISVKNIEKFDDIEIFHMEIYNNVLKDSAFWKDINADTCIIVQDDGFVMNGDNIEEYLEYHYIGAPWTDAKDNEYIKKNINSQLVGNGGFSIRNVEQMIRVCDTFVEEKKVLFYHNINEIPEDVYFVKHLVQLGANVAPFDVARKFAVEQVMTANPVGFHKFWLYHTPTETLKLFDSFIY
jgi:hypothetical protein